jgi:hypothetical protein
MTNAQMTLREYFQNVKGIGVLATADAGGRVNAALYAKPHFWDENDDRTVVFIMSDRSSHDNIRVNPSAAYLFIEEADDYVGKRLSLTRIKEETDPEKIQAVRRRSLPAECEDQSQKFLVYFRVDEIRPLVGAGPESTS